MANKPLLVLIADDYIGVAEMLGYLIEAVCGCEIATAVNGEEAVRIAMERRPGAIILDLDMPILGGIEAARILRRQLTEPSPLLIALSGGTRQGAAREAGIFDHVFSKPADIGAVADLLAARALGQWPLRAAGDLDPGADASCAR